MRVLHAVLLLASLLTGCSSRTPESNLETCMVLRDHAIDLSLETAGLGAALAAAHRQQLVAALADDYQQHCEELSSAEMSCALAARSLDALAACQGGAP